MAEEEKTTDPRRAFLSEGEPEFDPLIETALDLRWSWSHTADKLWETIEPTLWRLTHNPWTVLQSASRDSIRKALADPDVRSLVDDVLEARRVAAGSPGGSRRTTRTRSFRASPISAWNTC